MRTAGYILWAIGVVAAISALLLSANMSILVNDGVYLSYVGYPDDVGRIGPFALILSPTALIMGTILFVGDVLSRKMSRPLDT